MDDYVLLAEKRWYLKQALSKIYKLLSQLKLTVHPKKRAIGRVERGIYFLGYTLHPKRKLRLSLKALSVLLHVFAGFMSKEPALACSGTTCYALHPGCGLDLQTFSHLKEVENAILYKP